MSETTTERVLDRAQTLPEAVFQALGAASACWENLSGAGVFESTRAKAIGDELLAGLREGRWPDPDAVDVDVRRCRYCHEPIEFVSLRPSHGGQRIETYRHRVPAFDTHIAEPEPGEPT